MFPGPLIYLVFKLIIMMLFQVKTNSKKQISEQIQPYFYQLNITHPLFSELLIKGS